MEKKNQSILIYHRIILTINFLLFCCAYNFTFFHKENYLEKASVSKYFFTMALFAPLPRLSFGNCSDKRLFS